MTLDEAIQKLSLIVHQTEGYFDDDEIVALKLSIEALKRIRDFRNTKYAIPKMLLLGETKE